MGKLSLSDLLSFAKAGYTPKDVKELMSIDVPEHENPSVTPPETEPETAPASNGAAENAAKATAQDPEPEAEPKADDIDYKKKFEEASALLEKLQKENEKRNNQTQGAEKTSAQLLDDRFRELMK